MSKHYMAILPNHDKPSSSNYRTEKLPQPQPITIEEYRRRQKRKEEDKLTSIPPTPKPKHRRAGRLVALRRQLASLKSAIYAENPPHWQEADELWQKVFKIEKEMKERKLKKNTEMK